MKKGILTGITATAFAASMALAAPASAAVTFDMETGAGFVGKGDVQLALGLTNKQLQDGTFAFAVQDTTVTEASWVCTNTRNENTQERERTTTTSFEGVVSSIARVKNQITGFNLSGYTGTPTTSSTTDGNQLNSCPTNWVLSTPAGDPQEVSSTKSLTVNGVDLPITG